jgi:ABC-type nickel/cobalt efflux system permease component RcnA
LHVVNFWIYTNNRTTCNDKHNMWLQADLSTGSSSLGAFLAWRQQQSQLPKYTASLKNQNMDKVKERRLRVPPPHTHAHTHARTRARTHTPLYVSQEQGTLTWLNMKHVNNTHILI